MNGPAVFQQELVAGSSFIVHSGTSFQVSEPFALGVFSFSKVKINIVSSDCFEYLEQDQKEFLSKTFSIQMNIISLKDTLAEIINEAKIRNKALIDAEKVKLDEVYEAKQIKEYDEALPGLEKSLSTLHFQFEKNADNLDHVKLCDDMFQDFLENSEKFHLLPLGQMRNKLNLGTRCGFNSVDAAFAVFLDIDSLHRIAQNYNDYDKITQLWIQSILLYRLNEQGDDSLSLIMKTVPNGLEILEIKKQMAIVDTLVVSKDRTAHVMVKTGYVDPLDVLNLFQSDQREDYKKRPERIRHELFVPRSGRTLWNQHCLQRSLICCVEENCQHLKWLNPSEDKENIVNITITNQSHPLKAGYEFADVVKGNFLSEEYETEKFEDQCTICSGSKRRRQGVLDSAPSILIIGTHALKDDRALILFKTSGCFNVPVYTAGGIKDAKYGIKVFLSEDDQHWTAFINLASNADLRPVWHCKDDIYPERFAKAVTAKKNYYPNYTFCTLLNPEDF